VIAPLVRVGEIAEQLRGVSYGKAEAAPEAREGYLPVLRAGNITDSGLAFNDLVYVPAQRISSKQRIRKGDVVIAASSGSLDVVGKAAVARSDYQGGFGAFCKVMRPNPAKVEPAYFAHYFQTREYRNEVSSLAAGANINNLKNEHLDDLLIPLPSLREQRRIAAILDQADALRGKRRETVMQLDSLSQSMFIEMFGDPIVNPKHFEVLRLIELVDANRPISYGILMPGLDVEGGVKYVRVVDMKRGGIELSGIRRTTAAIANLYKRSLLKPGDLLMSIRGHVGRIAIVPEDLDGANITQDSARLAISGANAIYVRECLRTPGFQRWMAKHTKGVAVRGINLGDVKQFPIPVPRRSLQAEFSRRAVAVEKLLSDHEIALAAANQLVASLQYRAFRGEL